jgi:hypothetical protein
MEQAKKFVKAANNKIKAEGWKKGIQPPAVRAALNELEALTQSGKSVSVFAMERWLQNLNKKIRGSQGNELHGLMELRGMYDKFMDRSTGFMFGGKGAVNAFKKARAARREYAKVFEDDPKLMKMLDRDQTGELRLNDTEALDILFSKTNASPARGAGNTIVRIKSLLGPQSREWGDFKLNVVRRMMTSHRSAPEFGLNMSRSFQGGKFGTELMRLKQNKQVYESVFNAKERYVLEKLAAIAKQITDVPFNKMNPSGTSGANQQAVASLAHRMGIANAPVLAGILDLFEKFMKGITTGAFKGNRMATASGYYKKNPGYDVTQSRRATVVDPATGKTYEALHPQDFIGPLGSDRPLHALGLSRTKTAEIEMVGGAVGSRIGGAWAPNEYGKESPQEAARRRKQMIALERMEAEAAWQREQMEEGY